MPCEGHDKVIGGMYAKHPACVEAMLPHARCLSKLLVVKSLNAAYAAKGVAKRPPPAICNSSTKIGLDTLVKLGGECADRHVPKA
jgi:hypothetical protein